MDLSSYHRKFISFEKLRLGDYCVKSIELVQTENGERLFADIGNNKVVVLPERISKSITNEEIQEINGSVHMMKYKNYRIRPLNTYIRFLFFQRWNRPNNIVAFTAI